jgi:phenylpropionate dioxygenase-like ring-hydroxylating dioxygenase large terminal subunit
VIVSRTESGELSAMLNRCMHRAAVICRDERGNANFFRCPYHGWTYRNDGKLIGVPRRNRYPAEFDLAELDALLLPRLETYRGFIFGSLAADVPPLVEYLAQARPWLDRMLDLSIEGRIALRDGAHRHVVRANWKLQAENTVDGYHAMYLHQTFFEIQRRRASESVRLAPRDESLGWTMAFDNGHALLGRDLPDAERDGIRSVAPEYYDRLEALRGGERMKQLLTQMNLLIFPNLFVLLNQVRVLRPVSIDETIVTMYPFSLEGAPDALNAQRRREHEQGFAPAGFIGPDDYAAFECVTEGLRAEAAEWLVFWRGIHDERSQPDGTRIGMPSDETPQRGIYRRYRQLMSEEPA